MKSRHRLIYITVLVSTLVMGTAYAKLAPSTDTGVLLGYKFTPGQVIHYNMRITMKADDPAGRQGYSLKMR